MIAAMVYVVFAVADGAGANWLAFGTLGVFLYGAAAWVGLRGMLWLLAVGWAAHVARDRCSRVTVIVVTTKRASRR